MDLQTCSTLAMTRRRVVAGLGAMLACGAALPGAVGASRVTGDALRTKRLIVLKLDGGNDGLNTLVPCADPLYRRLRPSVGLPRAGLLPLNGELALHPRLVSTMRLFQAGELAIVQDVGYPRPNLSHFESGAVWEKADPRGRSAAVGWWGQVVADNRTAFDGAALDAAAITFEQEAAFAAGRRVAVLRARQDVSEIFAPATAPPHEGGGRTGAARALGELVSEGEAVRARVAHRLRRAPRPAWSAYEQPIDVQIKLTDWFLRHGVLAPVVRLTLGGFDTHSELIERHGALMGELDGALADLRARLSACGLWDDTVVLVHSEFGRRPAENGFGGTDHGTSGPVFLLGGRVQGGIYGARAALDDLDGNGNLLHRADLRRLYATLVSGLFQLSADPFIAQGFEPLPLRLA